MTPAVATLVGTLTKKLREEREELAKAKIRYERAVDLWRPYDATWSALDAQVEEMKQRGMGSWRQVSLLETMQRFLAMAAKDEICRVCRSKVDDENRLEIENNLAATENLLKSEISMRDGLRRDYEKALREKEERDRLWASHEKEADSVRARELSIENLETLLDRARSKA